MSLAFASTALAQSATENAYGGTAGVQQFGGPENGAVASQAGSSGVLPFTGLQLALIALVAVALIGTGLLVRRGKRPNLRA